MTGRALLFVFLVSALCCRCARSAEVQADKQPKAGVVTSTGRSSSRTCPSGVTCVPIRPSGGDDTAKLQQALKSTASSGKATEMTPGNYHLSPITFPKNSYLIVDAGVTVTDNPGYSKNDVMLDVSGSNVKIVGGGASASVFQMPNSFAASARESANCAANDKFCSQYRHCMVIRSTDVTVSGISCNQSGGDGVYISRASNVTLSNSSFSGNFRNGGSLIGQVRNININGDQDVNFNDNVTSGNQYDGFCVCIGKLNSASAPVSITVNGNKSDNNDRYGYF